MTSSSPTSTQLPHFNRTGHAAHCKRCLTGNRLSFKPMFFIGYWFYLLALPASQTDIDGSRWSTKFEQVIQEFTSNKVFFSSFKHIHSRLALAFYCIGSLDLLGVIEEQIPASERQLWREWLWQQQARRLTPAYLPHTDLFDILCVFFLLGGRYGSGFRPSPFMTAAHPCNPISVR